MSFVARLLEGGDWLEVWASAMWRASWQGGLAVVAVWAICRLAPSIPAWFQAWLWRLAMLKFAVALLWAAPLELPFFPAVVNSSLPITAIKSAASIPATPLAAPAQAPVSPILPWIALFAAWVILVGWQTARIATAWGRAQRLRRACRASGDSEALAQLAELCRVVGIRQPPALLAVEGQGSPLLVGLFRAAIVLPATTLGRLNVAERAMVLGHELAHFRRRDLAWSLVAAIVRAAFCFHPLAWLGVRQLNLTQEIAADELAIDQQTHDPLGYAKLLVSVVGKLGPSRHLPAMSVGAVGSQTSLMQRFAAMRFIRPVPRHVTVAYGLAISMAAALGLVPWTLVAAEAPAVDKVEAKGDSKQTVPAAQKPQTGRGRLVSFAGGKLTLKARDGGTLVYPRLPENLTAVQFDRNEGKFMPIADAAAALSRAKENEWIQVIVGEKSTTLRIGERKQQTTGTFVSFKDNRLLMMLKVTEPTSYTKKYGNLVHFNSFFADTPIYESIDGGEYQQIGLANKVLGDVKEGTIITTHAEGDDNITLVQLGVPKAKE